MPLPSWIVWANRMKPGTVEEKLKVGDPVKLNSGQGPALVVISTFTEYITVKWFDADLHVQVATFPMACVRKLTASKK
jgi:uncharacterized protein YodC (DUF2158 family)